MLMTYDVSVADYQRTEGELSDNGITWRDNILTGGLTLPE